MICLFLRGKEEVRGGEERQCLMSSWEGGLDATGSSSL